MEVNRNRAGGGGALDFAPLHSTSYPPVSWKVYRTIIKSHCSL